MLLRNYLMFKPENRQDEFGDAINELVKLKILETKRKFLYIQKKISQLY